MIDPIEISVPLCSYFDEKSDQPHVQSRLVVTYDEDTGRVSGGSLYSATGVGVGLPLTAVAVLLGGIVAGSRCVIRAHVRELLDRLANEARAEAAE